MLNVVFSTESSEEALQKQEFPFLVLGSFPQGALPFLVCAA
jgi:hypothetical protein